MGARMIEHINLLKRFRPKRAPLLDPEQVLVLQARLKLAAWVPVGVAAVTLLHFGATQLAPMLRPPISSGSLQSEFAPPAAETRVFASAAPVQGLAVSLPVRGMGRQPASVPAAPILGELHANLSRRALQVSPSMNCSVSLGAGTLRLIFSSDPLFALGSAELTHAAREKMAWLLTPVSEHDALVISVEGHTDSLPVIRNRRKYPTNWELSSARAAAIVRMLEGIGVQGRRLKVVGFGQSRPQKEPDLERLLPKNQPENRRIVIEVGFSPEEEAPRA